MKEVWTDCRIPQEAKEKLSELGCKVLSVEPCGVLNESIASHPDMNILTICGKRFTRNETFVRKREGDCFIPQGSSLLCYPEEAAFNAACVGNDFICCERSIYKPALRFAVDCGMNPIYVRQGYVKCNLVIVSGEKKAIITEDDGIAKTLWRCGYNVLKLNTHAVALRPFRYGFIGGASGTIDDFVVFTGNIAQHPEFSDIQRFCKQYDKKVLSLCETPLYDFGSILT